MKRMILLIFAAILLPAGVFAANDWKGRVVDETVIGYPANYTNVRNATEVEVETACKARMATEGRQVDSTVADENPMILKKQ